MIAFLRSIDYDVCEFVKNGTLHPLWSLIRKGFPNPRLIGPKVIRTRPIGMTKPLMPYIMLLSAQNFAEFSLLKL